MTVIITDFWGIKTVLFKIGPLVFWALLLTGCAASTESNVEPEAKYEGVIRDKLTTSIAENGLKLFTYSVSNTQAMPPISVQTLELTGRDRRKRSSGPDLTEWTEQIELGLKRTLAMSGFCREGSIEISRLIQVDRAEIRGECTEGATDEDRQRFGRQG
ncbi:hypothetical protein [Shewanella litorisediminis]|uniref:Lipoprotein n=1 Tax=Shewanella litorisediminis TaxID=1173586 RepID=A0ABX7FZD1_9GAMM|nr:hypothetical protein [Shewanella litorisediminis]QRH00389.1 hypothetical protein JQC75_10820 [Shewanella litorisediminis]